METENILRLIIVDESSNNAEKLASYLRTTGYAVRNQHVEDDEDLQEAIEKQAFDIILITAGLEFCSLERALEIIGQADKDIPIVAICEDFDEQDAANAMELGITDYVSREQTERLKSIIHREVNNLHSRRKLRQQEQMFRDSEKRCQALLDNSRDAIAYVHDGMHVYANPVYLEMFGFQDAEEVEGAPIMDMVSSNEQAGFKEFIRSYSQGKTSDHEFETRVVQGDGTETEALMEFAPATIDGESCTQVTIRGHADTKELQSKIQYLSKQDLVTGLFNRQYFLEELEIAINRAVSDGQTGAVLYILFDNCKSMKETIGIAAVDLVFGDIARVVETVANDDDIIARFNDSAFAILTQNKGIQEVQEMANKICTEVESHICDAGNQSITTTCSIGISLIGESTTDAQDIISRADLACEVAIKSGGNSAHLHNPVADERAGKERDKQWVEMIQNALDHNQFQLVYQPVVSLHGDPKERYEIFIRMIDSQGNAILPSQFMPTAESSGLGNAIDRWVINKAILDLAKQHEAGHNTSFLIKISGSTLNSEGLLEWIRDKLTESRLLGEHLIFEIAETTATSQLKATKAFVSGIKSLHCEFIIDHFGSGPNSFNLLKHLPADYLKIDGSFIHNLAENAENQALVKSITEMAHSMDKQTIAEFVEDASSLTMLWQFGVNYIQGYFLQEPDEKMTYDFSGETV